MPGINALTLTETPTKRPKDSNVLRLVLEGVQGCGAWVEGAATARSHSLPLLKGFATLVAAAS